MSDSNYQQAFFTVPNRIINLPGLTLQLLKFYEKIFQYWHHEKQCFIGNDALMKHCGMKSESTLSKAFQFFEKANEMKREIIDGKRYIIQPPRKIEIEPEKPKKLSTAPPAPARVHPRASETPPLATARHNNNNTSNNKNLNKSFYTTDQKKITSQSKITSKIKSKSAWQKDNVKKHDFAEAMDHKAQSAQQMDREAKHIEENNRYKRPPMIPMPESLRSLIKTLKVNSLEQSLRKAENLPVGRSLGSKVCRGMG